MTKLGRPSGNAEETTELQHRFIRRENTYHIALLLLRQQAQQRGDTATVFLINSVIQRANEGDAIKLDLMAMLQPD